MAVMIRNKSLPLPILQGGMGVGVSLDGLAGAVAACGGMGTISSALCGYREPDFEQDPYAVNLRALGEQVRRAKEQAKGAGLVAVNIMVATAQYADSVRTALKAGADAIVCGAGLPKDLPALAAEIPESDAALAPIVSSGRAAALLCKLWDKMYARIPDFFVLEGPLAGGHLGFSPEEAKEAQAGNPKPLDELLHDVLTAIAPFKEKYGRDIPVFVAGGVHNGEEMRRYTDAGAAGAQFATRFIATKECDASDGYKQALLNAKPEDITIVQSPVGMPGRALLSPLMQRVKDGTQPHPTHCMRCLTPCNPAKTPYCISRALIAAVRGDWENGLFFCGANAGDIRRISTVPEEMAQIMKEWRGAAPCTI
jgi:NAD(P)H-dependent flavin oxidoreductase YrpB (nitropropane dioxygenase family)